MNSPCELTLWIPLTAAILVDHSNKNIDVLLFICSIQLFLSRDVCIGKDKLLNKNIKCESTLTWIQRIYHKPTERDYFLQIIIVGIIVYKQYYTCDNNNITICILRVKM